MLQLQDMVELPTETALHMLRHNLPVDFAHSNGAWMKLPAGKPPKGAPTGGVAGHEADI